MLKRKIPEVSPSDQELERERYTSTFKTIQMLSGRLPGGLNGLSRDRAGRGTQSLDAHLAWAPRPGNPDYIALPSIPLTDFYGDAPASLPVGGKVQFYLGGLEDSTPSRRHTQELEAFNAILIAINEAPDLQTILTLALKQMVELLGVAGAECHLINAVGELELAAQVGDTLQGMGLQPEFVTGLQRVRFPLALGLSGQALAARAPIQAAGYQPGLCVPIFGRAFQLGVFAFYSHTPLTCSPETQNWLMTLADQLAVAIERDQLSEAARRQVAELARTNTFIATLNHMLRSHIETARDPTRVMEALGAELKNLGMTCLVALLEADTQTLALHYVSLEPKALAEMEALSGIKIQALRIPYARWLSYTQLTPAHPSSLVSDWRSLATNWLPALPKLRLEQILNVVGATAGMRVLYLPLVGEERVLGVLGLWGEGLREADAPALSIFAGHVAVAIQNARLFETMQRLSITDDLTGLHNRRHFFELGRREFRRFRRFDYSLATIMLDIDHFKEVNDTYGHRVGDQVLASVAQRCTESIRDIDILGRYGGEEFAILLPETSLRAAGQSAERLRRFMHATPIPTAQGSLQLSVSLGVACATKASEDLAALLDQADAALYAAKQAGRNCVAIQDGQRLRIIKPPALPRGKRRSSKTQRIP